MKLSRSYYESLLYDLLKPFVNLYDEAESSIIIPNEIEVSYDTRTMRLVFRTIEQPKAIRNIRV